MHNSQTALQDMFELLKEQHDKGAIDRRDFLKAAALLGAAQFTGAVPALAQLKAKEIVVANSGGDYVRGFYEAFGAVRLYSDTGEFHGGYGWPDLGALVARCGRQRVT